MSGRNRFLPTEIQHCILHIVTPW